MTLHNADCFEILASLPDNSIDAVITDPPYGLNFMGKKWDYDVPSAAIWKECLRVLKPGGHLLSFGGSRTYHRLAVAIEDAGFEIRDQIMWIYASGFPKSHNISKAIDKMAGAEREVIGRKPDPRWLCNNEANKNHAFFSGLGAVDFNSKAGYITAAATSDAKKWEGWGTALKPAHEPICVARKPISEKNIAENVLKWGTGGINIDECRISIDKEDKNLRPNYANHNHDSDTGFLTGDKYQGQGAKATQDLGYHNSQGRFPANIMFSHHPECVCVGIEKVHTGEKRTVKIVRSNSSNIVFTNHKSGDLTLAYGDSEGNETIEQWQCHPDCPVAILNQQSGIRKSGGGRKGENGIRSYKKSAKSNSLSGDRSGCSIDGKLYYDKERDDYYTLSRITDTSEGYASRFFFCSKASPAERNEGCEELEKQSTCEHDKRTGQNNSAYRPDGSSRKPTLSKNHHPTVKPLEIMKYLLKLVTPPNALVLDPFMGSGTTGVACAKLNRRFIGIEKEPEYFEIAKARIEHELQKEKQTEIFEGLPN